MSSLEILKKVEPLTEIVGIDEAQFFDGQIVMVAQKLAENGKRVIVAGLDTDWKGEPFGPMPQLLAVAEIIRKQYAICMVCGDSATRTQRIVAAQEQFLLGSTDSYEARCRRHFDPELSIRMQKVRQGNRELEAETPSL